MKDRATPDQRINPPTDGNAIHELHFKIVFHARRKVSEQEEQLFAIKLYKDNKYIRPADAEPPMCYGPRMRESEDRGLYRCQYLCKQF